MVQRRLASDTDDGDDDNSFLPPCACWEAAPREGKLLALA